MHLLVSLGHCEKAVEGKFTICCKQILALECLMLVGLKLYLSVFKAILFRFAFSWEIKIFLNLRLAHQEKRNQQV